MEAGSQPVPALNFLASRVLWLACNVHFAKNEAGEIVVGVIGVRIGPHMVRFIGQPVRGANRPFVFDDGVRRGRATGEQRGQQDDKNER